MRKAKEIKFDDVLRKGCIHLTKDGVTGVGIISNTKGYKKVNIT